MKAELYRKEISERVPTIFWRELPDETGRVLYPRRGWREIPL